MKCRHCTTHPTLLLVDLLLKTTLSDKFTLTCCVIIYSFDTNELLLEKDTKTINRPVRTGITEFINHKRWSPLHPVFLGKDPTITLLFLTIYRFEISGYTFWTDFLKFIGNPSLVLVSLRNIFYLSTLGALLKPVFKDRSVKEEASVNYANDFLHMMYKPSVEGEMQV